MIPTLLLVGLLLGRWWALPFAALGWIALVDGTPGSWPVAGALALANTAVGVAAHKMLWLALRRHP